MSCKCVNHITHSVLAAACSIIRSEQSQNLAAIVINDFVSNSDHRISTFGTLL